MGEWRDRPDTESAHHFEAAFCGRDGCGLHIIAMREDETPICEVVMSAKSTLALIDLCKRELYVKAATKDDGS